MLLDIVKILTVRISNQMVKDLNKAKGSETTSYFVRKTLESKLKKHKINAKQTLKETLTSNLQDYQLKNLILPNSVLQKHQIQRDWEEICRYAGLKKPYAKIKKKDYIKVINSIEKALGIDKKRFYAF